MLKLGTIAGVLSKPEDDLRSLYKIEGDEVTAETLESILKSEIPALKKAAFTDAKTEAYGRATREVKSKVEKDLAEKFGLTANDFETIITELETKIQPEDPKKDEMRRKEVELWKEKFNALNTDFTKFKDNVEFQGKKTKLLSELDAVLPNHFEISSPKLKSLAVDKFTNDFKFDLIDGQLQLFDGDKPLYKPLEEVAKEYFKEYFQPKQNGNPKPQSPPNGKDPVNTGGLSNDIGELMKQLSLSRSSKERAEILAKIKEVESK
jgi:hypothetical protein